MGANEKHDATYHGGEYTPTTAIVHSIYMTAWNSNVDPVDQQEVQDKARDEFTRWLETVRAEAKAEALEEVVETLEEASCPEHGSAIAPIKGVHWKATDRFADWLRTRANQYKEDADNGR